MAETLTRSPAAPAEAEEETFELSSEDLGSETKDEETDLEVEDEPESEPEPKPQPEAKQSEEPKEPEPKPEPVKAKVVEPEPEREEPRRRLDPIASEERAKRKKYMGLYEETKEQLDQAERTIQLLRAETLENTNDPALKKWNEDLLSEASKATDLADIVKLTIREMDRRDRVRVKALNQRLYGMQCDLSDARARTRYPDYDKVCRESGILDAIATDAQGNFKDQKIGQRIYFNTDGQLNADPGERIYRLAVGKLEYERRQRGEPEVEEQEESVPQNGNGSSRAEGKRADKAEVVEAERRGAARVVEEVSKNSTRLKGIRSIPKAASGPTHVSKRQLDDMMERDPERYRALIKRRPDLEVFHMS